MSLPVAATISGVDSTWVLLQNLAVARHLASDVVVLDQGSVVFAGDVAALVDDPALARRYLGLSAAGSGH